MKTPTQYGSENEETSFIRRIAAPDRAHAKRKQSKRMKVVGATVGLIAASAAVGFMAMHSGGIGEVTLPTEQLAAVSTQYDDSMYPLFELLDTDNNKVVSQTEYLIWLQDTKNEGVTKVNDADIPENIKHEFVSKLEANFNTDAMCALRAFKRIRLQRIALSKANIHTLFHTLDLFCATEPIIVTQEVLDHYTPVPTTLAPTTAAPTETEEPEPTYPVPTETEEATPTYPAPTETEPTYPAPTETEEPEPTYPVPTEIEEPEPTYPAPTETEEPTPTYPAPTETEETEPTYPAPTETEEPEPTYPVPTETEEPTIEPTKKPSGGEDIKTIIDNLGGYDDEDEKPEDEKTYMTKEEFHKKIVEHFKDENKYLEDVIVKAEEEYKALSTKVKRLDDCIERAANKFGWYGVYEQAPHFENAVDWVANVCMNEEN